MAEAGPSAERPAADDVDAELIRIEAEIAAGDADLRALGFRRLVARVKADRLLIDRYADRIGAIDRTAFRLAVRPRFPVWLGNAVLAAAALAGGALVGVAASIDPPVWKGAMIVSVGLDWAVALHCPTHWLVGRLVGIRFTDYFVGGPPPPRPGLKTDLASYIRADPASRAWMHASGAIATKLAPFLALGFVPLVDAPTWAAAVLALVGIGQIATDVLFSTKTSDWMRFSRERRVARARAAR